MGEKGAAVPTEAGLGTVVPRVPPTLLVFAGTVSPLPPRETGRGTGSAWWWGWGVLRVSSLSWLASFDFHKLFLCLVG